MVAIAVRRVHVGVAGANRAALGRGGEHQFRAPSSAPSGEVAGGERTLLDIEEETVDLAAQRAVEGEQRQRASVEAPLHARLEAGGRLRLQLRIADERIRRVAEAFHERRILHAAPDAAEPARLPQAGDAHAIGEGIVELVVEVAAGGCGERQPGEVELVFAGEADCRGALALVWVPEKRRGRRLLEALGL